MNSTPKQKTKIDPWLIIIGFLWLGLSALIYQQIPETSTLSITWSTETEVDTAGFNILRAERPEDGSFTKSEEACSADGSTDMDDCTLCGGIDSSEYQTITNRPLHAKGAADSGYSYTYEDETVDTSKKYCYILEDVELSGALTQHPPIVGKELNPLITTLYWILTPVCVMIGLWLIYSGFRPKKAKA